MTNKQLKELIELYPEWVFDNDEWVHCPACWGEGSLTAKGKPSKCNPPTHQPNCLILLYERSKHGNRETTPEANQ